MRKVPWIVFLWPGLPELWLGGHWTGLAKAIGAAAMLNAVLIGGFGWSELINSGTRNILLAAVGLLWMASAVAGYMQTNRRADRKPNTRAKDTFEQALDLYLKGDHFQAECLLVEMLGRNERDLDARLMLATLYRHNRRYEEAGKQLDTLARFEGIEKWTLEIERERLLIEEGTREAERQGEFLPSIEPQPRLSDAA
jgi:hypothetical protein